MADKGEHVMRISRKLLRISLFTIIVVMYFMNSTQSSQALGAAVQLSAPAMVEKDGEFELNLDLDTPNDLSDFDLTLTYDDSVFELIDLDSSYLRLVSNASGELNLKSDIANISTGQIDLATLNFRAKKLSLSRISILSVSAFTMEGVSIGVDASQTLLISVEGSIETIATPTPMPSTISTSTTAESTTVSNTTRSQETSLTSSTETTESSIIVTGEEITNIESESSTSEVASEEETTSEVTEVAEESTDTQETTLLEEESTTISSETESVDDSGGNSRNPLILPAILVIFLAVIVVITVLSINIKKTNNKRE